MGFLKKRNSMFGFVKSVVFNIVENKIQAPKTTSWVLDNDLIMQNDVVYKWDDNEIWEDNNIAKFN